MRYLNRIYYDNETLEIVFLFFGDTEAPMEDEEKDKYVFSVIGNEPESVSIILFPEPNRDVEAQLDSGMVPKVSIEDTYTDEEGNEQHTYRLDFVPREETDSIPSYSDLAQETQQIDMALIEMGVKVYE